MKNEFDNNLTDKGWQSMRRLLDREMPEQRRRRRFAWWPLALLLLPAAGVGGWWAFRPSKSDKIMPPAAQKPKISEPVAKAESPATLPYAVAENSELKPVLKNKSQDFTAKISEQKGSSPLISENAELGWATMQGREKLTASDLHSFATTTLTEKNDLKQSESIPDIPVFEKIESLTPLPLIAPAPSINVKAADGYFAHPKIKKKNKDRNWTFGVTTALASESFSKINGFSIGGTVNWQFARKWGLRSGLQYAQYRLSATERPVVSLDAEKYADATGNFTILDTMGSVNNPTPSVPSPEVLVPVEKLRHLEMPLLVYWQPVRPLRIFGGISTAYTLSAKASSQNYANNQLYYANNATAQKNLDELTSQTLSRWNTSWQAGIGVRLGRHLEVGAFYKQGFNSLGNGSTEQLDVTNIPSADPISSSGRSNNYFLLNGIWFF